MIYILYIHYIYYYTSIQAQDISAPLPKYPTIFTSFAGVESSERATKTKYPASENPNLARYLSGGGSDDTVRQRKIEEAIEAEGEPEAGGPRRYRRAEIERGEAEAIQNNGAAGRGRTATMERGEAEATMKPLGGQYGDNRERRSRSYIKQRGSQGGNTATIERGEAEAIQNNGAA